MDSPLRPQKLLDEYYSFNEGSSNEISSQDRSELLDILKFVGILELADRCEVRCSLEQIQEVLERRFGSEPQE